MDLDRLLTRAKLERDLFVQQPARDELADLSFAFRQACQACLRVVFRAALFLQLAGPRQRAFDRLEEERFLNRLFEKVDRPFTHRPRR